MVTCWNLLSKYGDFKKIFPHNVVAWAHLLPNPTPPSPPPIFLGLYNEKIAQKQNNGLEATGFCYLCDFDCLWLYWVSIKWHAIPPWNHSRSYHHPFLNLNKLIRTWVRCSSLQGCWRSAFKPRMLYYQCCVIHWFCWYLVRPSNEMLERNITI